MSVHRIVLATFVGPCPDGYEACHNDGDPTNNNLSNLRWDTHRSNVDDTKRHGTWPQGIHHPRARLTETAVAIIRAKVKAGIPMATIGAQFGVSASHISNVAHGRLWSHISSVAPITAPIRRRGDNNICTKLSDADAAAIKADKSSSGLDLASKYGVSPSLICGIRRGRFRKGVVATP
jgi:hypothetical protein